MGTVTLEQAEARSSRCRYAFRRRWASWSTRRRKGCSPSRRCRARRARRAARGRGCRDRRAEGQAHPGAHRGPAWARGGRGDARRPSGQRERPQVKQRLRRAWVYDDHDRALDQLRQLGRELDHSYPGAAGSLREGMEETLTLTRLGVSGNLKRTLESTNPVESMIEFVRWTQRNVKRWSSGEMALRWTAAGMLEAERQFRRIIGYRDLATSSSRSSATTTGDTQLTSQPRRPLSSVLPDHPPDRRRQTGRRGHGKGHHDELGDA